MLLGVPRSDRITRKKTAGFNRPERALAENTQREKSSSRLPLDVGLGDIGPCRTVLSKDSSLKQVATRVLRATLKPGTLTNYDGVIRDYRRFLSDHGYGTKPTEENVTHFILYLEQHSVTESYINKVKPAINLLEDLVNEGNSVFTNTVCRLLDGVKNLTLERKNPVQKAPRLPLKTLKKMVATVILPFVSCPEMVDAVDLRTVFRVVIEYFTFCRFNCFSHLEAADFTDNGQDIEICFRRAKNDAKHKGNTTKLVQNCTLFCPVFVTRFYFKRFGFEFNGAVQDRRKINCNLRRCDNLWQPQPQSSLSATTATEQLRNLFRKLGEPADRVTDKSAKMEGVTQMLEGGASMEDVAHHGRWRTVQIVQTYKHNSDAYKLFTASKIPF